MADDGWGDEDCVIGETKSADSKSKASGCFKCGDIGHISRDCPHNEGGGGGDNACRKCGEDGHFAKECPSGGRSGGDGKCRNCRKEGHMAVDCPEPEVCRRCRKEGHVKDDCPEPEICYNCRQEGHGSSDCPEPEMCRKCRKPGHTRDECPEPDKCYNCREEGHVTSDCPEPEKCRRCKQEGHKVADCPEPMRCNRCGEEGHLRRDCTGEEKTYSYKIGDEIKEMYVPKSEVDGPELYDRCISSGINFSKYDSIPVNVTGKNKPGIFYNDFAEAGLKQILLDNITKSGYTRTTPVQKYGIPILMAKRDLMACAQTGSGKTAAFLVPIINSLLESNADSGSGNSISKPQCVIITPTRELAIQIHNETRKFSQGSAIRSVVVYGGTSVGYQANQLRNGCNILVATPGRLLDFIEKDLVGFNDCKYVVLDEADRMLDMGFMPEVKKVFENPNMPMKGPDGGRQTWMFSATFPDEIQMAAQEFLHDYLFLAVGRAVGALCSDVQQDFIKVDKGDKKDRLEEILSDPSREPADRTLIFVQTKRTADFLATALSGEGLPTTSIHGDRLQRQREEALFDFRHGEKPILVATAVAARGLDIAGVAHVINYDMPSEVDEYIHRIGRTGRVGNPGKATSFVDPDLDDEIIGRLGPLLEEEKFEIPDWFSGISENGGVAENGEDAEGGGDDDDWD